MGCGRCFREGGKSFNSNLCIIGVSCVDFLKF